MQPLPTKYERYYKTHAIELIRQEKLVFKLLKKIWEFEYGRIGINIWLFFKSIGDRECNKNFAKI